MHAYTGAVPWDVIGIVDDVRESGLAQAPGAQIFASLEHSRSLGTLFDNASPYFAVQTDGPPGAMASTIRKVVAAVDPRAVPDRVATMEQLVSNSMLQPRFYAAVLGVFAFVAGLLAVVGIYGGIAFAVRQRTREIGIRRALGASRLDVLATVIGDSLMLAGLGVTVGVAGGVVLTRYLQQLLFDLTPLDPVVFVAVPLVFGTVVVIGAWLSAHPAMTDAPLAALRQE
jgi:ABC-type antimicrobial peptide transport system permease subunit